MSKYPGRIITDLAPAGYSVFFDGTGDYLSLPNDAAFSGIGSNDWTVEAWVYSTAASTSQNIITISGNTGAWAAIRLELSNSNALYLVSSITGSAWAIDYMAGTVTVNAWNHVAVTRSGTSVRLYVNGSQVGVTQTLSGSLLSGTVNRIGIVSNDSSFPFRGYISNVRYIRGTALYTGTTYLVPTQLLNVTNTQLLTCNSPALVDQSTNNFTITANGNAAVSTLTPFTAYVPYNPALGASTPGVWTVDEAMQAAATRQWNMYDPYFNLTTLLLHGNPTNGTTWLTDVSTNNFTLTPNGDARAANLSPFSLTTFATSGSAYLDGTGDFVSRAFTSTTDGMYPQGGTYTVEAWVYPTTSSGIIYTVSATNITNFGILEFYLASGVLTLGVRPTTGGSLTSVSGGSVSTNVWTHVAASVSAGSARLFVNGSLVAGPTSVSSLSFTPVGGAIGYLPNGFVGANHFNGYISNFRIVQGVVVYTGNFTTPTAPLTAVQAAGTNISAITGTQTSLLILQNSQSANNNAFLDSSSNNFLITRNGNTTQGTFSPFSQTGWSNYFGGTSDYLSVGTITALGSGDFTISAWVYPQKISAGVFHVGGLPSAVTGVAVFLSGTAAEGWGLYAKNSQAVSNTGAITLNKWYYLTVIRSGTTTTLFVDGVSAVVISADNTNYTQTSLVIGGFFSSSFLISGYISNFRIVGSALTATVPTASFTAVSGTTLLTCQSNRFIDNSSNGFTLTPAGTPSVQPFSPFLPTVAYTPQTIGGSGYFDGSGDFLSFPTNSVLVLGSGNFTAEAWVYPTAAVSSTQMIVGSWDGSTTLSWTLSVAATNAALFEATSSGSYVSPLSFATANNAIRPNSWNHIAVVRSGNAFTIYVNGVSSATATNSITIFNASNNTKTGSNTNSQAFLGYIAGTRVVVGTAVYTGAFTVPTSPFTPTMSANPYGGSNTSAATASALLNYTNAGVVDSTGDNVLETAGDARISTAVSRFGGSSMFFDGTGDAFVSPNSLNFSFGTGDFTIEAWIYPTARGVYPMICKCAVNGTWASGWAFSFGYLAPTEDKVQFWINGSTILQSTNAVPLNTWSHVAVSRSGTSLRMFVNGVQEASATNSTAISPTSVFTVGSDIVTTNYNYFGYIDDLRITRFARYTGAFTPQTSQWQDQ